KGVELTDAGIEMLNITKQAEDLFDNLKGAARNAQATKSGELVITSLVGLLPMIMPAIKEFNLKYPEVEIRVLTGEDCLKLEYGEAHVALRAGAKPTNPDYIVRKFLPASFGAYVNRNALNDMKSYMKIKDWRDLPFIGPVDINIHQPFAKWMRNEIPNARVVLKVDEQDAVLPAVLAGAGVGFLPRHIARQYDQLIDVNPLADDLAIPVWLISHRDLRKTQKVTEFIKLLMDACGSSV
ncbi:MAG: LysR family transcriptional regulator, partial [Pseudomonadota bacterium]